MPWTRCLALPAIFADWDGSPITYRYMADLTLKERKRLGLEAHDSHTRVIPA